MLGCCYNERNFYISSKIFMSCEKPLNIGNKVISRLTLGKNISHREKTFFLYNILLNISICLWSLICELFGKFTLVFTRFISLLIKCVHQNWMFFWSAIHWETIFSTSPYIPAANSLKNLLQFPGQVSSNFRFTPCLRWVGFYFSPESVQSKI